MTITKYLTKSADETVEIGKIFAEQLLPGNIVALHGELGSGKTEFIKGVCEYFNVDEMVNSPTFTIINQYTGEYENSKINIYHLDLYRIKDINELTEIGFAECIHANHNIKMIEWAEKAGDRLDFWDYDVYIKPDDTDEDKREIEIIARI